MPNVVTTMKEKKKQTPLPANNKSQQMQNDGTLHVS
jgi:hypothetical protein